MNPEKETRDGTVDTSHVMRETRAKRRRCVGQILFTRGDEGVRQQENRKQSKPAATEMNVLGGGDSDGVGGLGLF